MLAPLWLVVGFLDYACHRQQRIEATAGLHESNLHLLMLAELGAGVIVALFLELNAIALALLLLACVAHEFTVLRDLSYAQSRRRIPWFEQWVHGLQQAVPWVAFAALVLLHWPQALALVGLGDAPADWRLRTEVGAAACVLHRRLSRRRRHRRGGAVPQRMATLSSPGAGADGDGALSCALSCTELALSLY